MYFLQRHHLENSLLEDPWNTVKEADLSMHGDSLTVDFTTVWAQIF